MYCRRGRALDRNFREGRRETMKLNRPNTNEVGRDRECESDPPVDFLARNIFTEPAEEKEERDLDAPESSREEENEGEHCS